MIPPFVYGTGEAGLVAPASSVSIFSWSITVSRFSPEPEPVDLEPAPTCEKCGDTGTIPDPDRGSGWGPYWDGPCDCLEDEAVFATLFFDGGGQAPGPISAGVELRLPGEVVTRAETWPEGTNNEAEYRALILGLEAAHEAGVTHLTIRGDSMLVVRQVAGDWKVKRSSLKALHHIAIHMLGGFEEWDIGHIRREDNTRADELGREAMKAAKTAAMVDAALQR